MKPMAGVERSWGNGSPPVRCPPPSIPSDRGLWREGMGNSGDRQALFRAHCAPKCGAGSLPRKGIHPQFAFKGLCWVPGGILRRPPRRLA